VVAIGKVFKTELRREVTLDELMSDNAIVPRDAAQAEVAWELLQASPPSNSKGNRNRRQNQGSLNAGTRAVARRYEIYLCTGACDPVTNEALCAHGLCDAPQEESRAIFWARKWLRPTLASRPSPSLRQATAVYLPQIVTSVAAKSVLQKSATR
jgi:hypothetical protein